ncbi:O-methyltransferase [Niveomyces insectorum RCEF 264]|uniref:O-methyltransferase n=1 Tax=Niveomyces insectorum RCEF 264 TaxID=1081102 RepID=A0A167TET7_9HYPO|nr:O-methyltransferase [Niveomyces insectorum RCEF 264]
MAFSDTIEKIEALLADAKKLERDDSLGARMQLVRQIDGLYRDLEPPINLFFRQWISLTVFTCMDIVVKLGIFERMKDHETVTAQQLGALVDVDAAVIARVMRVLVAAGIVASTADDTYAHTPRSLLYVKGDKTAVDSFALLTLLNVSYVPLPDYLKTRPAKDLVDVRKSPYACAYGMEGKTFYEVLSANPDHLATFNKSMSEPGPDYGLFPFASLQDEVETEPDRPFMVDIGGGKGQALRFVQNAVEGVFKTPPKLILQDRSDVLEEIRPEDLAGIETMPYDFYAEQPVKGAHIYYLCQILHNYPDHLCQTILKRVAEAMSRSSRLLIVDAVLPAQTEIGGDMAGYLIDFVGLAIGGKERTEKEITALLDAEGLDLVKVWGGTTSYQSVVEARLKNL